MKKALVAFFALIFVTMVMAQAAGHWVRPVVHVSGVKGSAEVDVSVSWSGEFGASGHELRTIHGNGSVKFSDIAADTTRITFSAQVAGCGACRVSKRFNNEVPRSVNLEIP
jgi:hypothetical protein